MTKNRKSFQTHQSLFIPFYTKELLLLPHIQSCNEQTSEKHHDPDISDLTQIFLYNSNAISAFDDVSDDDRFCDDNADQSYMFNIEFHESAILGDIHCQPSRSKSDSENFLLKTKIVIFSILQQNFRFI